MAILYERKLIFEKKATLEQLSNYVNNGIESKIALYDRRIKRSTELINISLCEVKIRRKEILAPASAFATPIMKDKLY